MYGIIDHRILIFLIIILVSCSSIKTKKENSIIVDDKTVISNLLKRIEEFKKKRSLAKNLERDDQYDNEGEEGQEEVTEDYDAEYYDDYEDNDDYDLTYDIIYRQKVNNHRPKSTRYSSLQDTLPNDCYNFNGSAGASNVNFDWVIMLPSETNFSSRCIIIKSAIRVGMFFIYELVSPQITTVSSLVSDDAELVIFPNQIIDIGPGQINLETGPQPVPMLKNNGILSKPFHFKESLKGNALDCRTEPSDPNRGFLSGEFSWGIDRTDQRSSTLDGVYCSPNIGTGVNAYILDTGVSQHVTFGHTIHYDFSYYDSDPSSNPDCNGHGTHVGGLVASNIYGMAKDVVIHSVKVLDCSGGGTYGSLLAGLMFVYQHIQSGTSLNIINMSLGARDPGSASITEVINNIILDKKTPVVASAGNLNEDACLTFPASIPAVFTVAATDIDDNRAYFSNFGSCVKIWSPGLNIMSAEAGTPNGIIKSGTSMAAPIVTGAVALFLSQFNNPNALVSNVLNAVLSSATPNIIGNMQPTSTTSSKYVFVGPNSIPSSPPPPSPRPPSPPPPVSTPISQPTSGISTNNSNKITHRYMIIKSIILFLLLGFWNCILFD